MGRPAGRAAVDVPADSAVHVARAGRARSGGDGKSCCGQLPGICRVRAGICVEPAGLPVTAAGNRAVWGGGGTLLGTGVVEDGDA